MKKSLESKLQISSIHSIKISARNRDKFNNKILKKVCECNEENSSSMKK